LWCWDLQVLLGTQALDVIRRYPDEFEIVGLSAGSDRAAIEAQALEFSVEHIALGAAEATELAAEVDCDLVLNGITGSVGLRPTLAALRAGRRLALANKESLVAGGELVLAEARPGQLISVDSEHSAISQAMRAGRHDETSRVIITASGGPFRGMSRDQLAHVTPEQALHHPTWSMGPMITTNSATLVNKGLEVIEAHLLFDIDFSQIDVVVHPQSAIHSMVEFIDGSTIAQASTTDMRIPLALGLSWPRRLPEIAAPIDWAVPATWSFEPVDHETFPAIGLAKQAGAAGSTFPAVYNAANEEAVHAFHDGRLSYLGIVDTVADVLDAHKSDHGPLTVDNIDEAETWARTTAVRTIASRQ
jgi:1-deoxy-D-xylulose-5-phosphate reductoisomerase